MGEDKKDSTTTENLGRAPLLGHSVEWFFDDYSCRPTVKCDSGRSAWCHEYCVRPECEEGCVAPDQHEQKVSDECGILPWVNEDAIEAYDGPHDAKPIDGPIELVWDGDGYLWHYVGQVSGAPSSVVEQVAL
ncbi:MAG TPA: hypothetical protein VGL75_07415 [Acidothermaceae bacterium]|jgi:hypothetical protein